MNKVTTINLGGAAFQLEEEGYNALRTYLETAAERLRNNPDHDEILSDIEGAIADKFRARLAGHKNVVETREVTEVLEAMGPIEAEAGEGAQPATGGAGAKAAGGGEEKRAGEGALPRRLYRISDGAMIAGVCNGIAAYFNVDPTLVRLGFVFLTLVWGAGLLVYIIMAFVVPEAVLPEEKAAASGPHMTAQEFIRRAKEGYYEAMKGFPDRKARREWQRKFQREMRWHARHWKWNWSACGAGTPPGQGFDGSAYGVGFMSPIFSCLQGIVTILAICALVSLLATGAIFGKPLPASVPVWLGAVLLLIVYGLVKMPLKLARHACRWGMGQPHWMWSLVYLMDAMVWLITFIVLLWLAFHFRHQLHDAVQSIPAAAHQAADDIKTWWKGS